MLSGLSPLFKKTGVQSFHHHLSSISSEAHGTERGPRHKAEKALPTARGGYRSGFCVDNNERCEGNTMQKKTPGFPGSLGQLNQIVQQNCLAHEQRSTGKQGPPARPSHSGGRGSRSQEEKGWGGLWKGWAVWAMFPQGAKEMPP